MSTAESLRRTFNALTERLAHVVRQLSVKYFDKSDRNVIIIAPDYYWGDRTPAQTNALLAIKREYDEWFELLGSVFRNSTKELESKISKADAAFRKWIELGQNWSIDQNAAHNERKLREDTAKFLELLAIVDAGPPGGLIVISDTNAFTENPDPVKYRALVGRNDFTFLLLPSVLSELDNLKNLHRNPDYREKAKKAISWIKGWRTQGPLRDEVIVDKSIVVRTVASEPDMKKTLTWLDPSVIDDRIIASILEIQSEMPNDQTVLISSDINLTNNADAAQIPHLEL